MLESHGAEELGAVNSVPARAGGEARGTRDRAGQGERRPAASVGRYLTFTLQGEVYALDINQITEIIEFRSLTVVPMMPAFVRGVINLRGRVLPVVDLASRFGQATTEVNRRTSVIVVETTSPTGGDTPQGIGIMVDAVNKVIHLGADDIEPAPAFGTGLQPDFIRGMAKHNDDFIVLLDIEPVLTFGTVAEPLEIQVPADQAAA